MLFVFRSAGNVAFSLAPACAPRWTSRSPSRRPRVCARRVVYACGTSSKQEGKCKSDKPEPPGWRPAGLLRDAVSLKEVEMQLAEETLNERPDHPVQLRMSFYESNPEYPFTRALRREDGRLAIIAGLKRFQPRPNESKPERVASLNDIARESRELHLAGVDAFFLNTDTMRYGCEIAEATEISRQLATSNVDRGAPIVRQDIIIHPIQIAEAAASGAAAVCISAAAALPDLMELLNAATAMGVEAVVECHTEIERDLAVDAGATLLYLTNRDRATNTVHKGTAERLHRDIPSWVLTIGGGGLVTAGDTWSLLDAGFNAVALGETLLTTRRPKGLIDEIRTQVKPIITPFDMDFQT